MRSSMVITAACTALFASGVAAQARVGTLIIAHGGDDEWNARVHDIAGVVRTGGPVAVSFLMGPRAAEHRFQKAVRDLVARGAERIVVVPLLASSHSGHYEQVRYLSGETDDLSEPMRHHLHEAGITRPDTTVTLALTPALDASMELADVLADRALRLARKPAAQALFLVGHGPTSAEDHADWMANLRPVADSVARITGFRDVKLGLLRDDAPPPVRAEAVRRIREIIALQHELTGEPVVVVPILISRGYISTHKLPKDLEALPIAYDGEGLLPHPAIARWVERRVTSRSSTPAARNPDAR
jgi:sirohydrochlorin cobaltochelatase